ncbi:MAG: helix-turn-helix transcriptional regulator [Clostridiales bacterium]
MDIGKKIKNLRKEKGMSQVDLANKANVAQSAISYIERGGKRPNITTITLLAEALGIEPASFFKDQREKYIPAPSDEENKSLGCREDSTHYQPLNAHKKDFQSLLEQENLWFNGEKLTNEDKEDILQVLNMLWRKKNQ